MAKLRAVIGGKRREKTLALLYGFQLYPSGEVAHVGAGEAVLCSGVSSRVPLHLVEGTRQQLRARLLASIDALFSQYSDDVHETTVPVYSQSDGIEESGC
jgi:hypothetical protein